MKLQSIAKLILLLSLVSLVFRKSSFALYHIPNPYEIGLMIASLITAIDLTIEKRWKQFFSTIPRGVWIATIVLVLSILTGWGMAAWYRHIPTTLNTIHEFVGFLVAALGGIVVLYYSSDDAVFAKRCIYALLVPALYAIFILIPNAAYGLSIARDGAFHGLTTNVNTMVKTLMVPTAFAIVYALRTPQKLIVRFGHSLLAALLIGLLFWTIERASVLALLAGCFVTWLIYWYYDRNWKHVLTRGLLLVLIIIVGFLTVPSTGKKATLNRLLNFDGHQQQYVVVEQKSVTTVLKESLQKNETTPLASFADPKKSPEPRFQLWIYYARIALKNPLGIGPHTHMDAQVPYAKGIFVNPGPHNSFLQMWLWGGVIGLLALLYLVWSGIRRSFVSLKTSFSPFTFGLLISVVMLAASIFFNDNLQSVWFWIVLGLSLRL
jgi:hypothetical protein